MLQILGLRPHKSKKGKQVECFSTNNWRARDLKELLSKLPEFLRVIPLEEQWNLYYSVNHVMEGPGRKFERGEIIAFDIDKIDGYTEALAQPVAETVCAALKVPYAKTAVVNSGNGVHILIWTKHAWSDPEYFDRMRTHYKACCGLIDRALIEAGFTGAKADHSIFDTARIMRLPGTENRKKDRETRSSTLVHEGLEKIDFSLEEASGVPKVALADTVLPSTLKAFPLPDTAGILAGCEFLAHLKAKPSEVREPEWYAGLSILSRIDKDPVKAREIAHDYSKGHPGYSRDETDTKIDQALAYGPRTCKSIHETRDNSKCESCPHWGKVASPIMIQGEDFIRTEGTGFHFVYPDPDNPQKLKVGKPDYEGLRRYFNRKNPYIVIADSESVFKWDGVIWVPVEDIEIKAFAQVHFHPMCTMKMANEFLSLVLRNNLKKHEWFNEASNRKMNFENGVLDLEKNIFGPHDRKYGFRKVLPYAYDPEAKAPQFEKFIKEVTEGHQELEDILLEYGGYSLSGDENWEQKACVLQGEGSNGKSVFVKVLEALAGRGNFTSMTLVDLEKDTNRHGLDGALFNVSEETPHRSLNDSSLFKNLVSGGSVQVKQLYKQPYAISNRAKIWLLCNELPKTIDMSFGMFRRLIIIPFNAKFEGATADKFIHKKLFAELPGILNIMLAAYARMLARGHIADSKLVEERILKYREETDTVSTWFVTYCHKAEVESNYVLASDLYANYCSVMEVENEKPHTKAAFFKRLSRAWKEYTKYSTKLRINNVETRVVYGIKMSNESAF